MFGMERFDSANSELATHASFEEALKTVQDNLSKGVGNTSSVYDVVMADRKLAVFGVALLLAPWLLRGVGPAEKESVKK